MIGAVYVRKSDSEGQLATHHDIDPHIDLAGRIACIVVATTVLAGMYFCCVTRDPVVLDKGAADFEPALSIWTGCMPQYMFDPGASKTGCKRHHAAGDTSGRFVYRFRVPSAVRINRPSVSATLSSEMGGWNAPPDWDSDVTLTVNGVPVGTNRVIPDDGAGRRYTWRIPDYLLVPGAEALIAFEVLETAARRHGVCIYAQSMVPGLPDATIRLVLDTR